MGLGKEYWVRVWLGVWRLERGGLVSVRWGRAGIRGGGW